MTIEQAIELVKQQLTLNSDYNDGLVRGVIIALTFTEAEQMRLFELLDNVKSLE